MKLIIGLGNPGEKYAKVRHNLGFDVLDMLRDKMDLGDWKEEKKFKAEIIKSGELILACPQTYMNNSGMAVRVLTDYFEISPENVVVVHDELDLPLGKIKIRLGGAAAGHHGVESIINAIGDKFIRVRLGIGNLKTQSSEHKHAHIDVERYVLEPFTHSEKSKVKHMIKQSVKAIERLLLEGLNKAQTQFNN